MTVNWILGRPRNRPPVRRHYAPLNWRRSPQISLSTSNHSAALFPPAPLFTSELVWMTLAVLTCHYSKLFCRLSISLVHAPSALSMGKDKWSNSVDTWNQPSAVSFGSFVKSELAILFRVFYCAPWRGSVWLNARVKVTPTFPIILLWWLPLLKRICSILSSMGKKKPLCLRGCIAHWLPSPAGFHLPLASYAFHDSFKGKSLLWTFFLRFHLLPLCLVMINSCIYVA